MLKPFVVFGTNAIAAYVFSELLQSSLGSIHLHQGITCSGGSTGPFNTSCRIWPSHRCCTHWESSPHAGSFADALYRRRIFIKV